MVHPVIVAQGTSGIGGQLGLNSEQDPDSNQVVSSWGQCGTRELQRSWLAMDRVGDHSRPLATIELGAHRSLFSYYLLLIKLVANHSHAPCLSLDLLVV